MEFHEELSDNGEACPSHDAENDFASPTRPVVYGPLGWLVARKAFCVFLLLLGLVGLGILNQDMLADAYIRATGNPNEEAAKILPADSTFFYLNVPHLGIALRECDKIGDIIKDEAGDLGKLEKDWKKDMDQSIAKLLGQEIKSKEDLEALGLLDCSITIGVMDSNKNRAVYILTCDKADELAEKIAASTKSKYEKQKKDFLIGLEEEDSEVNASVTDETLEYKGCKIRSLKYMESGETWSSKRCFSFCVLDNHAVFYWHDSYSDAEEAEEAEDDVQAIRDVIDTYKGDKKSLYDNEEFQDGMDELSSERLVSFYFGNDALFEGDIESANEDEKDILTYIREHKGSQSGEILAKGGVITINTYDKLPELSPVKDILTGPRICAERFVPAEGLFFYAEASCDAEEGWTTFEEIREHLSANDKKSVSEFFTMLHQEVGVDFCKDVKEAAEARGFIAVYYFAVPSHPYYESNKDRDKQKSDCDYIFGLELKDSTKAQVLIDKLLKLRKPDGPLITTGEIGEYKITELKLDKKNSLVWIIIDDCLVGASDRKLLQKAVDVYKGKATAFIPPDSDNTCGWLDSCGWWNKYIDIMLSLQGMFYGYQQEEIERYKKMTDISEEERRERIAELEKEMEAEKLEAQKEIADYNDMRKVGKALHPVIFTSEIDGDILVSHAKTGIGKAAATGELTATDVLRNGASACIALFVVVLGVCCFIPRRLAV